MIYSMIADRYSDNGVFYTLYYSDGSEVRVPHGSVYLVYDDSNIVTFKCTATRQNAYFAMR